MFRFLKNTSNDEVDPVIIDIINSVLTKISIVNESLATILFRKTLL